MGGIITPSIPIKTKNISLPTLLTPERITEGFLLNDALDGEEMAKTNPNGSNQYKVDPRQAKFLEIYLNPKSPTYANAYRSAINAGYEDYYAKVIKSNAPKWVVEGVEEITKNELVKKAKKVLKDSLDSDDERIRQDTAKFIAKTDVEFSDKQEVTHHLPKPILGGKSTSQVIEGEVEGDV